jgi:hypothetical protein
MLIHSNFGGCYVVAYELKSVYKCLPEVLSYVLSVLSDIKTNKWKYLNTKQLKNVMIPFSHVMQYNEQYFLYLVCY